MKTGDLVEFKAGLFGIQPPENLAIYLDRVKRKGNFFVVLHTVKGRREVKPDNVTGRTFKQRLEPPFDEGDLEKRLRDFIKQAGGRADEREKPELAEGEVNDRVLWNKVWEHGVQTPEQMAERFYGTPAPTRKQVGEVRNVLASCAQPGVGYFEREPGRGEKWRPITLDEYKAIIRDLEGFNKLRKKLVKVVEEEDEETGWVESWFEGVPVAEAALDEDDKRRLDVVAEVMGDFVHHDKFRGHVGFAGTSIHTINGESLFQKVKFLALDWTGTTRVSVSSVFVEFLVDNGIWTPAEALDRVARRKVAQIPDFAWETPSDVERAAERCPQELPGEERARRVDLTHLDTYTIDPADAKDHDDAVSLTTNEDGTRTLWVHIADVSYYVEKDSTLDFHARKRATSVYLPTGVLPMLPHRLSDDLCSLNEGVDRFAMTAKLTFDANHEIVKEEFVESVVRVTKNIAYEDVLTKVEEAESRGEPNEYSELEAFARALDAKRRGLVLETGERRVRLQRDEGQPAGITYQIKHGNRATKMIEVFMVTANEAVARKLTREGVPTPYRVHPLPDRENVLRFNKQMETMDLPFAIELPKKRAPGEEPAEDAFMDDEGADAGGPSLLDQLKKGGKMNLMGGGFQMEGLDEEPAGKEVEDDADLKTGQPKVVMSGLAQLDPEEQDAWLAPFRKTLDEVRALEDARLRGLVYQKTLSCMGRAVYSPHNMGHFGLGSTCYAHFTSPIRRYPDLMVHRQLRAILRGEEPPHGDDVEDLCNHCTEQSVGAEQLERGTVDVALVFVSLNGNWDGTQPGLVNGLTKGGLFLSLPDGLEARLATSDIPGGPWSVDDAESMLFRGSADDARVEEEVTAANWRDLYNPDMDEVVRVRYRLGDDVPVVINGRDFVDGRVSVKLAGGEDAEEAA